MAKQTQNGKAFEFACLDAISKRYKDQVFVLREKSAAYETAKKFFDELEDVHKSVLISGSEKGVEILERLEANLIDFTEEDKLKLSIQADAKGQSGDVRDIIIQKNEKWEIGISAKHNHEAVKHSRLSPTIDFGDKWMSLNCSEQYFDEINVVFEQLEELKGIEWNNINLNKVNVVYKPLLNAFKKETMRLYEQYGEEVPKRLVRYLLGEFDFYKFILDVNKRMIRVNAYNLDGSLNKKTKNIKSEYNLSKVKLPTKIYYFDYAENSNGISDNTMELICNNGWQISFRIHSASSKIETSMKFDVKLIGVPVDIPTFIGII